MKKSPAPKLTASSQPRYIVKLSKLAQKQLDKLPETDNKRLTTTIQKLGDEPRPSGVRKLKGQEGYRIRVGDYRVLYTINDKVLFIEVVKVGQRGNFYDE